MKTNKLVSSTAKHYLKLPLNEREKQVWFWPFKWYQKPYALAWGEWDKFDEYIKKNYPVQHFLREDTYIWYFVMNRRMRDFKYKIKNYISNPRKEMRAKVFPPRYEDLDFIIVTFCLECIIELVDREKCFDVIVWDNDEEHIQRARVIKEIYAYAKTGRKALQDRIDKEWELLPLNGYRSLKVYEPVELLEQEMRDLDTKYCSWVVTHREYFWT